MLWPIIGTKYRLNTDCLFKDTSSFHKSHVVTIVKSRDDIWNWIASTRLLFRLYFVLLNVEDDTWLITESLVISLSSMSTAVKSIFVVLLTKTNNQPIIGQCRLSNGRYRLSANWPIIGRYQLSADNRCTSSRQPEISHMVLFSWQSIRFAGLYDWIWTTLGSSIQQMFNV